MDKSVIFAVAGSGKTRRLIGELDLDKRILLLSYTENNIGEIRRRIVTKFRHLPPNITVMTYFAFLNSFCYRPLLSWEMKTKGISFDPPSAYSSRQNLTNRNRYVDTSNRVYHARMAKALEAMGCIPELQERLNRYFDKIFVDEVQDFGGHDFNLLMHIVAANTGVLLVGDFFQHTYSTSLDGNVNASLHKDYGSYRKRFEKSGLKVDLASLVTSRRCSDTVCSFIRQHLAIDIHSSDERKSKIHIVQDLEEVAALHATGTTVKLFLQEHERYGCYSNNWGASKGLDHFMDVCVVLNDDAWKQFDQGKLAEASAITRNKLYVACSRTRGDLYIVPDKLLKKFKAPRQAKTSWAHQ